jgi:hypothetical protein
VLVAPAARAEGEPPVTASFDWKRGPGADSCIDADTLGREVERRLARPVLVPKRSADLVIDGTLSRGSPGWHAKLVLRRADGTALGRRDLTTLAEDCSSLDESLALVVALMVDIPRSDIEPAEPAPVAKPRGVVVPAETYAPRRPWHFDVAVLPVVAVGIAPKPVPGGRVLLSLTPPSFARFELEASGYLSARADAEREGAGSDFQAATVGVFVCPLALGGLSLCGGQVLARLAAAGFGFDQSFQQSRLAAAVGVRGRLELPLVGPLSLRAGLGADGFVWRDRFFYTRADGSKSQLFRVAPLVGSAEVGFGLSFPSSP